MPQRAINAANGVSLLEANIDYWNDGLLTHALRQEPAVVSPAPATSQKRGFVGQYAPALQPGTRIPPRQQISAPIIRARRAESTLIPR